MPLLNDERELSTAGYDIYDALHLAAAEAADADRLLSGTNQLIKRAVSGVDDPGIPVTNLVSWRKGHGRFRPADR